MPIPFSSIGIVGLGLMGGSLARALQTAADPPRLSGLTLLGHDLAEAEAVGAIDRPCLTPEEFFPDIDLVVFCTPLSATVELLGRYRHLIEAETVVTDVVSLKQPLERRVREMGLERVFVGSHPMAGGEGAGFNAGRADLYRDARVWIVKGDAPEETVARIEAFWSALGARPRRISALEHDRMMTWVSHLPQVLSSSLGGALAERGKTRDSLGPGGRDMTRLAGSNPELWTELLGAAPETLQEAVRSVEIHLEAFRTGLQEGKLDAVRELLEKGRIWFEDKP